MQHARSRPRCVVAIAAAWAAATLVAGCAVGPNFRRPAAPEVDGYTREPLPAQTASAETPGGAAQRFVPGQDIPGQWWTLFRSPQLNALIEQALKANPDLQAAQAALREAKENVYAQRGALFPAVDATASASRQKSSIASATPSSIYNLYNASVSVSYTLDLFGGTRRRVEALAAQAEDQRFQLEAAYLTLTSNMVTAAVQEASLRAQIAATQDIIKIQSEQLDVLQRQFELGAVSRAAVLAQQATLAQTQATLPPLEKQLAQVRNQLTALAGRFPSQDGGETFDLPSLQLPQDLPLSLPSQLVEQRPDVRSAEARLHEANAEIGVATANMLPQLTLSADLGSAALEAGKLFSAGTAVWSIASSLTQPIFQGGTLLHKKRAAVAAHDQAAAQYRSTVLSAFQDVANALRALQSDADALKTQVAAERSAADSLAITQRQFQLGAVSYLSLLDAQRTYQQARIALVQAQATRYADTAALFQALGGGWWNRSDVAADGDKRGKR
jgi:NodT family efflux transporter outer membrane factor (OMF) lipoprotein